VLGFFRFASASRAAFGIHSAFQSCSLAVESRGAPCLLYSDAGYEYLTQPAAVTKPFAATVRLVLDLDMARKKPNRKKKTTRASKPTRKTKPTSRAKISAKTKKSAARKHRTRSTQLTEQPTAQIRQGVGLAAEGGQSGDIQGLSGIEDVDSESVRELAEEGQDFEAGIVSGVENAPDPDVSEVKTHEVPEDDVPEQYRTQD